MIKALALTAALMGGFFSSAHSQQPMPKDMYEFAAPMTFMCVDSFVRMMEILEKNHQEIPIVMSHLTPSMSMILFVNHDSTTSTVVVTRRTKEKEQACIVFGGASNGTSFSLNKNPVFPIEANFEG
tara:strand:+ start:580 stop:957 length:378 start_codon:yes stop_codon:yes gene_type:complete